MADYVAQGGWEIEAIRLDGRECFRVSRLGYLVGRGYCYSLAELERLLGAHGLGLGDLVEDDPECELAPGMTKAAALDEDGGFDVRGARADYCHLNGGCPDSGTAGESLRPWWQSTVP